LEATNSFLKEQLQKLHEKLDNSQLQEEAEIAQSRLSQEICALNRQLAACKSELTKDATNKERLKAEMLIFKGNFKYTVVKIETCDKYFYFTNRQKIDVG